MAGEVKRASRVAEGIREELSMLLTTKVRDPRLAGVLVSRVELSDDLRIARVFYRLLEGGDDATRLEEAKVGLGRAAGLFRKEIRRRSSSAALPNFASRTTPAKRRVTASTRSSKK